MNKTCFYSKPFHILCKKSTFTEYLYIQNKKLLL
nr:MAG TPA: hypothetical protein [Caudoviricetes sp.]